MAYPTDTGQSYTTINGTDNTGATLGDGLTHSGRHNAVENEVTALKEKVGINGDSDNSTLDFKTSEITGGDTAVGKSATQTLTNKTLTSPTISLWDGWDERTVGDYSYASTTTINTSSDKTGEIQVGDKIKIVTAGGTFYFFVTAITSSLITVYGGTDYTVPNATFTQFAISRVKAPFGFPLDPDKWTVTVTNSSNYSQGVTSDVSWYNLGSISITLPPGTWMLDYQCLVAPRVSSVFTEAPTQQTAIGTSATGNRIADSLSFSGGTARFVYSTNRNAFLVSTTSSTTYYLQQRMGLSISSDSPEIRIFGGSPFSQPTILKATIAYL